MNTMNNPNQIGNPRVWAAIVVYRIDRSPSNKSEIYDALNERRDLRASKVPKAVRMRAEAQIRAYGRIENAAACWQA